MRRALLVLAGAFALSCQRNAGSSTQAQITKAERVEFVLRRANTAGHAVLMVRNLRNVDIELDRTALDPPCIDLMDSFGNGLSQSPCTLPRRFDPATEVIVIHPNQMWEQEFSYQSVIDDSKDRERARYVQRSYGPMSQEAVKAGVLAERMRTNLLEIKP